MFSTLRFRLTALMTILLVVTVVTLNELNRRSEEAIRNQVTAQITEMTVALEIGFQSINSGEYLADVRERLLPPDRYRRIKHLLIVDSSGLIRDALRANEIGRIIELPVEGGSRFSSGDPLEREGKLDTDPDEENEPREFEEKRSVFIPIRVAGMDGKPEVYYIVIVMSSLRFDETLIATSRNRLFAAMGVLFIGLIVATILVWRFTDPVWKIAKAARRVADGDLNFHLGLDRRDEIGQLAGDFDRMVVQLRDKLELEERLNQAERAAVIGRLVSGIAHEIRNPLNFINLTIDHIRSKFAPAETESKSVFERLLVSMKEEIARLNSLVNNVLRYGRPARVSAKSIKARALVENIFRVIRAQAEEQGVELVLRDETDGAEMMADGELLTSCFSNLAINAVQAMPSGGTLTFTIRSAGDNQVIEVSDTGVGIPGDKLDLIFEPYYSTKETGIGLGLALTRKLIEEHSGVIKVSSSEHRGTTFTISLPVHREVSETSSSSSPNIGL